MQGEKFDNILSFFIRKQPFKKDKSQTEDVGSRRCEQRHQYGIGEFESDAANISKKESRGVTSYNVYELKDGADSWIVKMEVFKEKSECVYHIHKKEKEINLSSSVPAFATRILGVKFIPMAQI